MDNKDRPFKSFKTSLYHATDPIGDAISTAYNAHTRQLKYAAILEAAEMSKLVIDEMQKNFAFMMRVLRRDEADVRDDILKEFKAVESILAPQMPNVKLTLSRLTDACEDGLGYEAPF